MGYFSKASSLLITEVPTVKLNAHIFPEKCEVIGKVQLHLSGGGCIKNN